MEMPECRFFLFGIGNRTKLFLILVGLSEHACGDFPVSHQYAVGQAHLEFHCAVFDKW